MRSAYNSDLYSQAPYYEQEKAVFEAATPRPVTPLYTRISEVLQIELNAALTNQKSPQDALASAQSQIDGITHGTG